MARKPQPQPEPLPDSLDPVEIALDEDRHSPDTPARALLVNQNRLVLMQLASERMGVVLKALTGVAGLAAAAALGALVWDAAHDRSLVIEAFSTPPDLAADGMTGQVLATELLDKLAAMDSQTQSLRRSAAYASSWSGDAKVEIPTTGISVGELQRFLRAWLGNQTRISGELVRGPKGLSLTVRAGALPGLTATRTDGDVQALLQEAAGNLYKQTQPYRAYIYASRTGSAAEGEKLLRGLTRSPDQRERVWAWSGLSFHYRIAGDPVRSEAAARRAVALDPDFAPGWGNIGIAARLANHPEAALEGARRSAALFPKMREAEPLSGRYNALTALRDVAQLTGDWEEAMRQNLALRDALHNLGDDDALEADASDAELLIAAHRPSEAERRLTPALWAADAQGVRALWIVDRYERGLWAEVIAAAAPKFAAEKTFNAPTRLSWERNELPLVAIAHALDGDLAAARALLARLPDDAYDVQIAEGRVAETAGDHAAADRWFGRAVKANPSAPRAYVEWARVLVARGQAARAIPLAATAAQKAPRFADAQSVWGEALLARGDTRAAEARFRAAAAIAPRYGRNQLLWGKALAALGRPGEARDRWLAARSLDLQPGDRAEVQRLLAGR